ncbi:hypothetical protein, partial [Verrucomicrobium spinosum]|uniref:hypothetical protein n=1 Tax=Verrucomicrobium spinosum TaxID=2736 RepID=UPI000A61B54B
ALTVAFPSAGWTASPGSASFSLAVAIASTIAIAVPLTLHFGAMFGGISAGGGLRGMQLLRVLFVMFRAVVSGFLLAQAREAFQPDVIR